MKKISGRKNSMLMKTVKQPAAYIASLLMLLTGCTTYQIDRAPPSATMPWSPNTPSGKVYFDNLSVSENPFDGELSPPPAINQEHVYQLPELIDMAQLNNPDTRIAWQKARQAAIALGMTEATFLPMISASVIGGYQKIDTPSAFSHSLDSSGNVVISSVGFQWLLFDFGKRSAMVDAARNISFSANISFNGIHQKLIYDVTRTYFLYGAALSRMEIAQDTTANSRKILDAALARRQNEIATTVEVAQAKQLVAQAELNLALSKGTERDAWQALLGAIGISPVSHFKVSNVRNNPLREMHSELTQTMIKTALSRRPDLLASYAAAQAAISGIRAAEADFLPKVYLGGVVASGKGHFNADGLPAVGAQSSSSNILLGISVPLYDGGIRTARVQEAQSRAAAASDAFKKNQEIAVREIVVSANALSSALESHRAALHLVSTAMVTYDAALEAYRNGVGTITVANEASNGLLAAQQMSTDAHASALISAANLAFVMGEMTQGPTATAESTVLPYQASAVKGDPGND